MDNKQKKKLDSKRFALGEKYEVDYCRRIAGKIINNKAQDKENVYIGLDIFKYSSFRRIAKAFLKVANALTDARKSIRINHSVIDNLRTKLQDQGKRIAALEKQFK